MFVIFNCDVIGWFISWDCFDCKGIDNFDNGGYDEWIINLKVGYFWRKLIIY